MFVLYRPWRGDTGVDSTSDALNDTERDEVMKLIYHTVILSLQARM